MKKLTLAASLAVLATGATALYAAPGDRARHGDTDGNGTISRAEAQAQVTAMFARMDANGDGRLDQADRAARKAQMFDRIDADRNGSISRAEFDAHHARPMGDRAKGGEHKMAGDHAGMNGLRMGGRGMRGGGMAMLRMADANNDGAVTRDEATAAALRHFDMVDTSKDGQISKAERAAAMKAMAGKWRERRGVEDSSLPVTDDAM